MGIFGPSKEEQAKREATELANDEADEEYYKQQALDAAKIKADRLAMWRTPEGRAARTRDYAQRIDDLVSIGGTKNADRVQAIQRTVLEAAYEAMNGETETLSYSEPK